MPDKHEVDGSIPFEPTKAVNKTAQNNNKIVVGNYKQVVQGKQRRIFEIILVYIEKNYDEV